MQGSNQGSLLYVGKVGSVRAARAVVRYRSSERVTTNAYIIHGLFIARSSLHLSFTFLSSNSAHLVSSKHFDSVRTAWLWKASSEPVSVSSTVVMSTTIG